MPPEQWVHTRLGAVFSSRRDRGRAGIPTLSVTLTNGLVERSSLERKTDSELTPEEHLAVMPGDIAYNMMRMWQGASGVADREGLVSPAYVVLKPRKSVDPQFMGYLFKSPRMIYLFWAYSYGLTSDRLRLYFKDFAAIPFLLPDLQTQRRIAAILSTWDRAIVTTEKLIANSHEHKRSLAQQLLSGKKRFPGFSTKWTSHEFSDIAKKLASSYIAGTSDSQHRCIELEHIESDTGRILSETSTAITESNKTHFSKTSVLFGKLRPYLRKFAFPGFDGVCSSEIWVFEANTKLCTPEYLYYLVQTNTFVAAANASSGSKMPRADWDYVKNTVFDLPGAEEQERIVAALRTADELTSQLNHDLVGLRKEAVALMQTLLSGQHSRSTKERASA